jgi:hypothetical protein
MSTFAAKVALGAAAWASLSTISANKSAAVNINLANRSTTENVEVKVAISTSVGDPTDDEIIEPGQVLGPKGVLKLTGEPMAAGETVKVYASVAGVTARSSGFEK